MLKRLFEAGFMDADAWRDAEPIFQQLNLINKRRNSILHESTLLPETGRGVVTNAAIAHFEDRITGFHISPEILDDMTADLQKIMIHLHSRHMGPRQAAETDSKRDAILCAPWRYTQRSDFLAEARKSVRQGEAGRKVRRSRPKPSPQ
jgi:hypothetical protein